MNKFYSLIFFFLIIVSCENVVSKEEPKCEVPVEFSTVISPNLSQTSTIPDEMQIHSWELFLLDKVISTFVIHEVGFPEDPSNPEPFKMKLLPSREYEMYVYTNNAEESHTQPGFPMCLPTDSKWLPGAAHTVFTLKEDGFTPPVIVPQVFRLNIKQVENRLAEDIVLEDVYLASAAVTSDYGVIVDADGYCTYSVPHLFDRLSKLISMGQSLTINTKLYAFPLMDDAPKDLETYLILSTNQGFYYYTIPREMMARNVSMQIDKIIIERPGGDSPFKVRPSVKISSIGVIARDKEDNVDIVL